MQYRTLNRASRMAARFIFCAFLILTATSAQATSTFFEWSSTEAGSGGGFDAIVNSTIRAGSAQIVDTITNAPEFVAEYGDRMPFILFGTPNGPADIDTTISFSSALPAGSTLLIVDVDAFQETLILSSGGAPLLLLSQLESLATTPSAFPVYDAALGELVTQGISNNNEVSLFDLSGLSSVQVNFRNGNFGSAIGVAVAVPVPEPNTAALLALGLAGLAARSRKRARVQSADCEEHKLR